MEILFELIFQFVAELLLQATFEFLAEIGYRNIRRFQNRTRNPAYAIFGFTILGGIAGGVSLLLFPHSPIGDPFICYMSLFVTPFLLGLMMVVIGRLRRKKGENLVPINRFGYAFAFAFAMGLVRFIWAV
jgi:hypothetical protein